MIAFGQELQEIAALQDRQLCFFPGRRRCRTGHAVQQGHIAEKFAVLHDGHGNLIAQRRGHRDPYGSPEDDVKVCPLIALAKNHVSLPDGAPPQERGQGFHLLTGKAFEKWHSSQQRNQGHICLSPFISYSYVFLMTEYFFFHNEEMKINFRIQLFGS